MISRAKTVFHEKTETSEFIKSMYMNLHNIRTAVESVLSDELFAQKMHKRIVGQPLDLKNPTTFDDKQWWIKFHYHDPLMTQCADKYLVRRYVEECGLNSILNEMYFGGLTKAEDIDFDSLPDKFYIKTNHGCGGNICVDKRRGYNRKDINRQINRALKRNYYNQSREWPYKDIKPCIMVEKFIDSGDKPLLDYRFLCFNGEFKYLFVDYDTSDEQGHHKVGAKRNIYSREYELLDYKVGRASFDPSIAPKPLNYEEMIKIAELLSKPFPFVRVDLYNIEGNILFGELTFFHAGGCNIIEPQQFSLILGNLIKLPEEKL